MCIFGLLCNSLVSWIETLGELSQKSSCVTPDDGGHDVIDNFEFRAIQWKN